MHSTYTLRFACALLCLTTAKLGFAGRVGPDYRRDAYRDIRWLGRGNAGLAVIQDGTSVFYNPGGIARNEKFNISILNPYIGANQNAATSYLQFTTLTGGGGETLSERFEPFLGKPLALQGGVFPYVATPNFVGGVYDSLDFSLQFRDPVYPRLEIQARNDYGIVTGYGQSLFNKKLTLGASIRLIRRKIIQENLTAGTLLANSSTLLTTSIRNGDGYGLNLGAQFQHDIGTKHFLALGAAIEDFGFTRFRNSGAKPLPGRQYQTAGVGGAYGFRSPVVDTTIMLDIKNFMVDTGSFTKKLFMGVEVDLPLADLRAGYYQGYWTAGFSLSVLPLIDLDVTSYAEELDYGSGQRTNRFWMLGIRTGLELKGGAKGKKKKQKYTLDNI